MTIVHQTQYSTVHAGDCLDVLKDLPDESVDAVITDPPYGLSNTTPAQVTECLREWATGNTTFVPAKRGGFMGKDWDSFVPPPAVWAECFRVLKPGGHLLAFAGSRTQDLMGMSVRMAGFDIRDNFAWLYGQGFSKSWNFSTQYKGQWCSCSGNAVPLNHASDTEMLSLRNDIHPTPLTCGESEDASMLPPMQRPTTRGRMEEARPQGASGMVEGGQRRLQGEDQGLREPLMEGRNLHRAGEGLPNGSDAGSPPSKSERVRGGTPASHGEDDWQTRSAAGGSSPHQPRQGRQQAGEPEAVSGSHVALDDGALRGRPECARCGGLNPEYKGFGTGLKPAFEPVIMARKPFRGTVASNVLEHGTGAINIDASRIETGEDTSRPNGSTAWWNDKGGMQQGVGGGSSAGRFPANVILDESQAAALDEQAPVTGSWSPAGKSYAGSPSTGSHLSGLNAQGGAHYGDSGGASRFFYVAKAPKPERPNVDGVAHPTVKPLTLLRHLVRMVTPPGGTVLDPFAGSGTTLEAATQEGFTSIGIEAHPDYLPLIAHRLERTPEPETPRPEPLDIAI